MSTPIINVYADQDTSENADIIEANVEGYEALKKAIDLVLKSDGTMTIGIKTRDRRLTLELITKDEEEHRA